ncbi:MAG: hypothetical protein HN352_11295 [Bacteroidetes bacterium]|nr:hypothetical protein [Bacteroidota bacterium]MBT4400325.1 hypothetical protein [Bacteroidota bacterium]MBT4408605.1 hypothetical protein [Bacteroidota bacterium]MBT5425831.1 hypothetical protein [Bacteroidota bacterium]MBT7092091.1 hypothetical protein [Bacteroidota bacterium]
MQFLYPVYLYGLFLVAIPIIIHLFKLRRYRTVYFSNLSFIEEAESSHKRKSKLQNLLLLLVRILLIILIVMAFAQPYSTSSNKIDLYSGREVGILIDQSMSMSNEGLEGTVFDESKKKALDLVSRLALETRITLFNAGENATYERSLDKFEAIEKIKALQLTHLSENINDFIVRYYGDSIQQQEQLPSKVYVFSDYQQSFLNPYTLVDSIVPEIILIPAYPQNTKNIYIDSCWLSEPIHHFGSRIKLSVRISNTGYQDYHQFPVKLLINDSLISQESIEIPSENSTVFTMSYMPFSTGWQKGMLSIRDYPVDFDNNFYFSFSLDEHIRVCHLYEDAPNLFIQASFSSDEVFQFQAYPISAYPNQDFDQYSTLIISDVHEIPGSIETELITFVTNGGNLILFPPQSGEQTAMNRFLIKLSAPRILDIISRPEMSMFTNELKDFYSEISLNPESQAAWPFFTKYFRISKPSFQSRSLLETQSGRPLIIQTTQGKGSISLASFALHMDYTDLPTHPVFIPTLYYLASSDAETPRLFTRLGSSDPFKLGNHPAGNKPIQLSDQSGTSNLIPFQFTNPNEPGLFISTAKWIGSPGFLHVKQSDQILATIALNYSRNESELKFHSATDIQNLTDNYGTGRLTLAPSLTSMTTFDSGDNGSRRLSLYQYLLLGAIILLIFESFIYRINR